MIILLKATPSIQQRTILRASVIRVVSRVCHHLVHDGKENLCVNGLLKRSGSDGGSVSRSELDTRPLVVLNASLLLMPPPRSRTRLAAFVTGHSLM